MKFKFNDQVQVIALGFYENCVGTVIALNDWDSGAKYKVKLSYDVADYFSPEELKAIKVEISDSQI